MNEFFFYVIIFFYILIRSRYFSDDLRISKLLRFLLIINLVLSVIFFINSTSFWYLNKQVQCYNANVLILEQLDSSIMDLNEEFLSLIYDTDSSGYFDDLDFEDAYSLLLETGVLAGIFLALLDLLWR